MATALVIAPEIPRALLIPRLTADWKVQADMFECCAIHTNRKYLSRDETEAVRAAGFTLRCYTVNDAGQAETLFGWGVEGVLSDYPDLIFGR